MGLRRIAPMRPAWNDISIDRMVLTLAPSARKRARLSSPSPLTGGGVGEGGGKPLTFPPFALGNREGLQPDRATLGPLTK